MIARTQKASKAPKNKVQRIDDIRKQFREEWLLFRVVKAKGAEPITGELLEHAKRSNTIYRRLSLPKYKNRQFPVFITYSQDNLPKGYVAAF